MKEEAQETVESKIFAKFGHLIKADQEKMAKPENNEQNPLSHAYISTCSFSKKGVVTVEEEKKMVQGYHADKTKMIAALDAKHELRELARKNLISDGNLAQGNIDPLFADAEKMIPPNELVLAFLKMQKAAIKFRLSEDEDFIAASASGSTLNPGQFENLKKLN